MAGFQSIASEHFGGHSIIVRHVMATFGNLNKRVRQHYLDENSSQLELKILFSLCSAFDGEFIMF